MVWEDQSQNSQRSTGKGKGLVLRNSLRTVKSTPTAALWSLLSIEPLHLSIEVEAAKGLFRISRNVSRRVRMPGIPALRGIFDMPKEKRAFPSVVISGSRMVPGMRKEQERGFTEGERVKDIHTLWDNTLMCTRRNFCTLPSALTGPALVEKVNIYSSAQIAGALLKPWISSTPNLNWLMKFTKLSTNWREQVRSPCSGCLIIWASGSMRWQTVWLAKQTESIALGLNSWQASETLPSRQRLESGWPKNTR